MINLFWVEKTIANGVSTTLVDVPCSVKKFRVTGPSGGVGQVIFRDGDIISGADEDPIRCRLRASSEFSDMVWALENEIFRFDKKIYVTISGAVANVVVGVYLMGNPVGP